MDRALSLFASRGYEAVGIQEIVTTSGVSKPTLYHYFKSKQGLLGALLTDHFSELHKQLKKAADYHGDLTATLENVVNCFFEFARRHRKFYRLQLNLWFSPPESDPFKLVKGFNGEQHEILQKLFLTAVREHGNMRGRHHTYAATFLGMINTYIALYLNEDQELDQQTVFTAVHQFMHGILS